MAEDRKFRWNNIHKKFQNRISREFIPDDEPVIIFRARDIYAIDVLAFYADRVKDQHHHEAVMDRYKEFSQYRKDHPSILKEPGVTHHIKLNRDPN